jgi:hypothetical protein
LRERREQWERQRHAEAEQAERNRKQNELAEYLRRRGKNYMDHTGQQSPRSVVESGQRKYVDEQELIRQAEREAKLAAAEAHHDF